MKIFSEEHLKDVFSKNLKYLMIQNCISETELSSMTEISQSAINRIKNGQVCPSLYQSMLIASALNKKIEDLINDLSTDSLEGKDTYAPIINTSNILNNRKPAIIGFVENSVGKDENVIGFKVDDTFNCKILNKESVVVTKITNDNNCNNGDTILFVFKNKYMIGTVHLGFIKPIDNLLSKLELKDVSIIGNVLSIKTKYIKDKNAVHSIIERFSMADFYKTIQFLSKSATILSKT